MDKIITAEQARQLMPKPTIWQRIEDAAKAGQTHIYAEIHEIAGWTNGQLQGNGYEIKQTELGCLISWA